MMAPHCFFCLRFPKAKIKHSAVKNSEFVKDCEITDAKKLNFEIKLFSNNEIIDKSFENVFQTENITSLMTKWKNFDKL